MWRDLAIGPMFPDVGVSALNRVASEQAELTAMFAPWINISVNCVSDR